MPTLEQLASLQVMTDELRRRTGDPNALVLDVDPENEYAHLAARTPEERAAALELEPGAAGAEVATAEQLQELEDIVRRGELMDALEEGDI